MRSEGQRQLLALEANGAEVARRIDSTRASVSAWRLGSKVPTPDARRALEAVYGIPLRAWESRPASELAASLTAPPRPREPAEASPAAGPPASAAAASAAAGIGPASMALAKLEALLATVQAARMRENLSAGELAKLATTEAQLVERVAQAQRAARAESAELEDAADEELERPPAPAEDLARVALGCLRMVLLALESHPWPPRDGLHPHAVARNALHRYGEGTGQAWIDRLLSFHGFDDEAIGELVRLAADPTLLPGPRLGFAGHESDRQHPSYRAEVKRWTEGEHFGRRRKA